jgi:hypothetical protein
MSTFTNAGSGYIGCRNKFLGIDSWAPSKFKIPAQKAEKIKTV